MTRDPLARFVHLTMLAFGALVASMVIRTW